MLTRNICGFMVTFVATGSRSWSFLTVNFKVSNPEKENLVNYISTTQSQTLVVLLLAPKNEN